MCRFSIIVPMLGQEDRFEDTLASVLRHRPDNAQIVVAHEGIYRDPYGLGSEVQFVAADRDSGLTGLVNIALCYVAGDITILIRPGIELDENWEVGVAAAMTQDVAAVSPLIVSQDKANRVLAAGVNIDKSGTRNLAGRGKRVSSFSNASRSVYSPLGPTSWLAAYQTSVLKAVAPLDEALHAEFIDVDIALSFKRLGFKSVIRDDFVGLLEDAEPLMDEMVRPHGASAQRIGQRFGAAISGNLFANAVADILRIPFSPWRGRHLLQRLSAKRWRDIDAKFADQLKRLAIEKPWNTNEVQNNEFRWRRAA